MQNNQEYLIQFVNTTHDCFLFQHVKKPTRYREGEIPNILDLVPTYEERMIDTIDHYPGLGKSYHECLLLRIKITLKASMRKLPTLLTTKIGVQFYRVNEISESYDNLCSVLEQTITDNMPLNREEIRIKIYI